MQMWFGSIFQLILSLSRLIDGLDLLNDSKQKYQSYQKKCFST